MAVLSKQGEELWRIELLTLTLSYRSNGVIMKNRGAGWKIAAVSDVGETPEQWKERTQAIRTAHGVYANKRPWFEAFKMKLHDTVKLKSRGMVWDVIRGLPERDADALFSDLDDYAPGEFSQWDCKVLMDAYVMVVLEKKKRKEARS